MGAQSMAAVAGIFLDSSYSASAAYARMRAHMSSRTNKKLWVYGGVKIS